MHPRTLETMSCTFSEGGGRCRYNGGKTEDRRPTPELIRLFGERSRLWYPSMEKFVDASEVLSNKIILLYFSASWCTPCKQFTPTLSNFYTIMKSKVLSRRESRIGKQGDVEEKDVVDDDFEVIFLSSDYLNHSYKSYASEMPWYCVGPSYRRIATDEINNDTSEHFDAPPNATIVDVMMDRYGSDDGIPHLVVIDRDGKTVLCDKGVEKIANFDPCGFHFPWRRRQDNDGIITNTKSLVELLPESCTIKQSLQREKQVTYKLTTIPVRELDD